MKTNEDVELLKATLQSFKFPAKYKPGDWDTDTEPVPTTSDKTHYGYTDSDLDKLKVVLESFKFPKHSKPPEVAAPTQKEDEYFKDIALDTYQFPKKEQGFLEKIFKKQILPVEGPTEEETGETPGSTILPKLQYNAWR